MLEVPLNGQFPLRAMCRFGFWGDSDDAAGGNTTSARFELLDRNFVDPFEARKHREIKDLTNILQTGDKIGALGCLMGDRVVQEAVSNLEHVPPPCIAGTFPPITRERIETVTNVFVKTEKEVVATLVKKTRAAEYARLCEMHDSVLESRQRSKALVQDLFVRADRIDSSQPSPTAKAEEEEEEEQEEEDLQQTCIDPEETTEAEKQWIATLHARAETKMLEQQRRYFKWLDHDEDVALSDDVASKIDAEHEIALQEKRQHVNEARAEKQARKVAREAVSGFRQAHATISRIVAKADKAQQAETEILARERRMLRLSHKWEYRTAVLAERQNLCLQQRRQQIDQLKLELDEFKHKKASADEAEVSDLRAKIAERKVIDNLMKTVKRRCQGNDGFSSTNAQGDAAVATDATVATARGASRSADGAKAFSLPPLRRASPSLGEASLLDHGEANYHRSVEIAGEYSKQPSSICNSVRNRDEMRLQPPALQGSKPPRPPSLDPNCTKPWAAPSVAPGSLLEKPSSARQRTRSARHAAAQPWIARLGGTRGLRGRTSGIEHVLPAPLSAR
eukprot:TRINITY_DN36530_c0_g1_i1.p1 TRINITY_DN36530_c0_g1~~TRINITY_DN36530_c0_g1_i1.p1  ORF type:complete len:654 (-),score=148.98 TRINITY_DN36530_c0_g1_i1:48-1742(-)